MGVAGRQANRHTERGEGVATLINWQTTQKLGIISDWKTHLRALNWFDFLVFFLVKKQRLICCSVAKFFVA